MINIGIIDDDIMARNYLREIIHGSGKYKCNIDFKNSDEVIDALDNNSVFFDTQILLVDIQLPGINGLDLIDRIKKKYLNIECIVMTVFEDDEFIFKSMKCNASGYITKSTSPEKILQCIQDVLDGGIAMSNSIARKVFRGYSAINNENKYLLTLRENEILEFLSKGYNYKEIGALLYISGNTVRKHIGNIYTKLNVSSKMEAIRAVGLA